MIIESITNIAENVSDFLVTNNFIKHLQIINDLVNVSKLVI